MAIAHLANGADSISSMIFGSPERQATATSGGDLRTYSNTKFLLHDALSREETLHRQIDELNRRQEILSKLFAGSGDAANCMARLTTRERQIMELVLAGHPSKNIAADLGIAIRTVENHRGSIMKKTGSRSLPALVRFALAAAWNGADT